MIHTIDSTHTNWLLGIADEYDGCEDLPMAVDPDTQQAYELEYCDERIDPAASQRGDWGQDWASSRLDAHWGDTTALLADLRAMAAEGRLRLCNGIRTGLPGADPLGNVFA